MAVDKRYEYECLLLAQTLSSKVGFLYQLTLDVAKKAVLDVKGLEPDPGKDLLTFSKLKG